MRIVKAQNDCATSGSFDVAVHRNCRTFLIKLFFKFYFMW